MKWLGRPVRFTLQPWIVFRAESLAFAVPPDVESREYAEFIEEQFGQTDIEFTSRQGAVLETTTLLASLMDGAGLTTTGDANSDLDITTRDGTTYGIDNLGW